MELNNEVRTALSRFRCLRSDDDLKPDLELTHEPCGTWVADVEAGDELLVLVDTALDHLSGCQGAT